jgi:hypothetical protein
VVGQAVEQGASQALGPEHRCPFIEGQIAGDQRAARSYRWLSTSNSNSPPTAVKGT